MQWKHGGLLAVTVIVALVAAACSSASVILAPTATAQASRYPTRVPSFTPGDWLTAVPPLPGAKATAQASVEGAGTAVGRPSQAPVAAASTAPVAAPSSASQAVAAAPTPAPASASGPSLTITAASANVRAGPGTVYPVIGQVSRGQQLPVSGRVQAGDWWQVVYQGKPGWVAGSLAAASPDAKGVTLVSEIPPTPAQAAVPAASPEPAGAGGAGTGHIAFASGRGNTSDIALLDVATGKVSIVVSDGRQPDVWTDGQIAFKGAGNGRDNIFTVRPDGSFLRVVSSHGEDAYPHWAPTKLGLAYYTLAGGTATVCRQWDTTGPQDDTMMRVEWIPDRDGTPNPVTGSFPTWLTNGRLAFSGCDNWLQGSNCGIWTMDVDQWRDFRPYPLTTNSQDRPNDSYGETLIFSSATAGNWDIYAIRWPPPSRKIDPRPVPVRLTGDPAQDVGATFSPDGKSIAFVSNRGGSWGIWVMSADGSNQRLLAAVPQGFGPHWEEERISWGP